MQSEIVALKQALSVNAFDYDSFFRLINLLKTANGMEALKKNVIIHVLIS